MDDSVYYVIFNDRLEQREIVKVHLYMISHSTHLLPHEFIYKSNQPISSVACDEWNYLIRWSPFEASWTNGCLCSRSTAILDCADAGEHREIHSIRTVNRLKF